MRTSVAFAVLSCLLLAGSPRAFAVQATNLTTSEVVFDSAGLEAEPLGVVPSPNGALVGSWRPWYIDEVITGGSPGAYQGAKYIKTVRDAVNAGGPEAHFAANQDFAGDQVHMEFMLYLPAGADDGFFLHGASAYYRAVGRIYGGGGGYFANLNPAGSYDWISMPVRNDVWQKWTLDYTIGSPNWTVGVDGSSITVPVYGGPGDLDGLYFSHNGYDTYYIDAVPEPASLALLAVGACALLRRGRRHA